MEKKKNEINWPLALVLSTIIICSSFILMTMIASSNPFEISFESDDEVVEITDNFRAMSESIANAEADLVVCETKLSLYIKNHGDLWVTE